MKTHTALCSALQPHRQETSPTPAPLQSLKTFLISSLVKMFTSEMTFREQMIATFSKRMNTVVCSLQRQASFLLVRDLSFLSQATEQNALLTPSHSFHHNLLCNERLLNQPYPKLRKKPKLLISQSSGTFTLMLTGPAGDRNSRITFVPNLLILPFFSKTGDIGQRQNIWRSLLTAAESNKELQ